MQNYEILLNPDMISNYIAIVVSGYTSYALFRRWRKDRETYTSAISISFTLQFIALSGALASAIYYGSSDHQFIVDVGILILFLGLIVSFIPLAYFYTGIFKPRNKWYLAFVSFLAGNATIVSVYSPDYYNPTGIVYMYIMLLVIIVFVPLAISCFRTAPLASRKLTKLKFRLVGSAGLFYLASLLLTLIVGVITTDIAIQNMAITISGILVSVYYIVAYIGWVMPTWFKNLIEKPKSQ